LIRKIGFWHFIVVLTITDFNDQIQKYCNIFGYSMMRKSQWKVIITLGMVNNY